MTKETLLKKFLNGLYGKNQTDKFLSEVAFVNTTCFKLTVYYGEYMDIVNKFYESFKGE